MLIVDGVTYIPLHISRISYLYHLASTQHVEKFTLINSMYFTASTIIQIGIGAYFTLMTIKRENQIGETH